MNKMKFMVLFMSITIIFSGCASMNNTGKGAAIGGGAARRFCLRLPARRRRSCGTDQGAARPAEW